jgi:hypothetical protein
MKTTFYLPSRISEYSLTEGNLGFGSACAYLSPHAPGTLSGEIICPNVLCSLQEWAQDWQTSPYVGDAYLQLALGGGWGVPGENNARVVLGRGFCVSGSQCASLSPRTCTSPPPQDTHKACQSTRACTVVVLPTHGESHPNPNHLQSLLPYIQSHTCILPLSWT